MIRTSAYDELINGKVIWRYFDFAKKLASWKKFRRSIFTTLSCDEQGQYLMGFDKTEALKYKNIGTHKVM